MPSDTVGGRDRRAAGLALGLLGIALVVAATTVGLYVAASNRIDYTSSEIRDGAVFLLAGLATPLLGAVLAWRRPSNPIGWLFLAGGAAGAYGGFAAAYAEHSLVAHPGALPGGEWVLWGGAIGLAAFYLPAVFALIVFPDGSCWFSIASGALGVGPTAWASLGDGERAAAERFLEATDDGKGVMPVPISRVMLPILGFALLALALPRGARPYPRWAAIALPVGWLLFLMAPGHVGRALGALVLLGGFVPAITHSTSRRLA